jgi:hypothetical protein
MSFIISITRIVIRMRVIAANSEYHMPIAANDEYHIPIAANSE